MTGREYTVADKEFIYTNIFRCCFIRRRTMYQGFINNALVEKI